MKELLLNPRRFAHFGPPIQESYPIAIQSYVFRPFTLLNMPVKDYGFLDVNYIYPEIPVEFNPRTNLAFAEDLRLQLENMLEEEKKKK